MKPTQLDTRVVAKKRAKTKGKRESPTHSTTILLY